ncbi:hypothetical protein YIM_22530 [Amycolatopsis sp. YIM 10]|nr:hypothetical protein YIM_22530 [Amycolatopsis sp. YIM 10]
MDARVRARQFLLLCALAFAVVGMHHLLTAPSSHHGSSHETAAMAPAVHDTAAAGEQRHGEQSPGSPAGSHEMLHLCLAVLGGLGLGLLFLAAFWLRTGFRKPAPERCPTRASWAKWRPPDRSGRSLLTTLCVHRL